MLRPVVFANTNGKLRWVLYLMFGRLNSLILNCNLYQEGKRRSGMLRYVPERGQMLQGFENLRDTSILSFRTK